MAVTKLTPTKLAFNLPGTMPTSTVVGSDGMEVVFNGNDGKILIAVDTAEATIKAGNGLQGVADLTVGTGKCVTVESGKYVNVSGTHKGTVYITGATAKVLAVQLP